MKYTFLPLFVVFALIFTACDEETSAPAETEYKHVVKTIYTEVTDTLQDTVTTNRTDTIIVYQDSIVHDTLMSNLNCETIEDNGRITITCGENEIQVNKGTCDSVSFDPEKNFCYNGQVMDFCDGYAYNPGKYFCFNDSLINLCNGFAYDPITQECVNDTLYGVCGTVRYNMFEQFCHNDSLHYLCGGKSYDPATHYCQNNKNPAEYGYFTDERDNQTYKYVVIGNQTWMAQNLNYAYLQPTAQLDSSSFCFKNVPDSCAIYGRLYLWSAAVDSAALFSDQGKGCGYTAECFNMPAKVRGVCPEGWHMPDTTDWKELMTPIADSVSEDGRIFYGAGVDLISTTKRIMGIKGTDAYGFSIIGGGFYDAISRTFCTYTDADFWSKNQSQQEPKEAGFADFLLYQNFESSLRFEAIHVARQVRCLKD